MIDSITKIHIEKAEVTEKKFKLLLRAREFNLRGPRERREENYLLLRARESSVKGV